MQSAPGGLVQEGRHGHLLSQVRAELKVPRPEEQTVTADASRLGHGFTRESRVPVSSTAPTSKSGENAMPSFMEETAAAIPDDLATLRPEDIRVEAEFVDLVVTTSEGITSPAPAAKECAGNNFPVFPKYVIKPSARSQTGRRAAWTPMHRKSNGR